MIPRTSARTILIVVASLVATAARAAELGTAFTYQGELELDGRLVTGQCDFEFTLWDDPTGGSQVGDSPQTLPGEDLIGGRFTVPLDFGVGAVTGDARWLEISVCCPSPCAPAYSDLVGRQELTPAPHAIRASTGVGPPNALEVDAASGNVGIGTTTPTEKLDVAGNIHASGTITSGSSITVDGATDTITATSGKISFDNEDLVTTGNVGIGTTTPTARLEIAGTPGVDGIKFPDGTVQTTANPVWTKDGDDIFYTAGSVGIGTTTPLFPVDDTLVSKSALPFPNDNLACAASSATGTEKIYCFGGDKGSGLGFTDAIVEYDPGTDTATTMNAILPTPRVGMGCATYPPTGKIYCFGGSGPGSLDQIVEYDPNRNYATDEQIDIMTGAVLPSPRQYLSCAASNATGIWMIYCFGGHAGGSDYRDEITEYDPDTNTLFTKSAALSPPRYGLACATDPNTGWIYCFGGRDSGGGFLMEVVIYDPVDDLLSDFPVPLPSGRHFLSCAASDSSGTWRIYCFGGLRTTTLDQIVELDPALGTLEPRPIRLPQGTGLLACAADSTTGKIYCFGGRPDATPIDQIVEYTPPGQALLQVGDPGDGTGAMANTWSVFSSRAFKRDISPLGQMDYRDILDKLIATDAVRYRYADDARRTRHLGVIAEDSPPEILDPSGKAVSLSDYATFLMAAIKAQQMQIEELKARVDKITETKKGGAQ